jgi:predicted neutral ceramidase superfamily lipid hydrolase
MTDPKRSAVAAVEPRVPIGAPRRDESDFERYDRNLGEILGELRVALPGVQVLFAFLLVAPFNQRFGGISQFERDLYLAALLCTLLASTLLIAPVLLHRLTFHLQQKAYIVQVSNRLMIAGLAVLAVALACSVLLVTHYLFGVTAGIVTTAAFMTTVGLTWFALPLRHRRRFLPESSSSEGRAPHA